MGALLTLGSLMMTSSVSASQVFLDVQGSITSTDQGAEQAIDSDLLIDEGHSAVIEIDRLLRIELSPEINAERQTVMLNASIYTWDGEALALAATPAVLTEDRRQASIRMSLPHGQNIAFDLTPEIR